MTDKTPPAAWRSSLASSPLGGSALTPVLLAVIAVGALYFGREILVPIALAVLLTFVLAPPVRLLQHLYVPRVLAVGIVVSVAFMAILGLGGLMASQLNQLAGELPSYQATLRQKIQHLRGAATGTSTLERASEVLQDLGKELDRPKSGAQPRTFPSPGFSPEKPITVEVKQPDPGALQSLVALITPLLNPLATAGIVLVFVIFILIQRQDLRNRLVRLAGARDLQRTTAAMDDAGERLSRLFVTQLAVNVAFGIVIGIGLWFIGVPSAPLWGALAGILRFVPYVGAVLGAIFPLVLAAAVGPDWSMALWTAALFVVVEPVLGHVIEPLLYGHSTGLSPVAVIAAATFWTWLWGPVGLVLATPLTVCLVVLGRHVDQLAFLDVMLGDKPALTPPELVYQRLLAGDPVEAIEQADQFLKEKPLIEYYEQVVVEGLKLAEADAQRGSLNQDRMVRIRDTVAEIVDDLSTHVDEHEVNTPESQESTPAPTPSEIPESWGAGKPVLCVPGLSLIDEAATLILSQLIAKQGIGVRAEQAGALSITGIVGLETSDIAIVCLCYVESVTMAQIRYSIRRLRRKAPQAFMLVTLLGESKDEIELKKLSSANVEFAKTLAEAIGKIRLLASSEQAAHGLPVAVPTLMMAG
jgi:predicted PurR-regulated permease PerM